MRIPQTPERIKEAPAQALRAVFAGVGQVLLMTERIRRRAIGQEHSHPVAAGGPDTSDAPAPARDNGAHTATLGTDQADQVKTGTAGTSTTGTSTTGTGATAANSAAASTAKTSSAETSKAGTAKAGTAKAGTAKAGTAKAGTARASTAKTSSSKTGTTKASAAKTSAAKASTAKTSTAKTGPAKTEASTAKADTAKAVSPPAEAATSAQLATATPVPSEAVTPAQTPPPDDSASSEVRASGVLPVPHYSELSIASLRARLRGLDIAQVRDLITYERTHEDRANVIAMFERRIAKLEEAEGADPAAG